MKEKLLRSLVLRQSAIKEGTFLRFIKFETTKSERVMLLQKGMVFKKGRMYYLTQKGAQRLISYRRHKEERNKDV